MSKLQARAEHTEPSCTEAAEPLGSCTYTRGSLTEMVLDTTLASRNPYFARPQAMRTPESIGRWLRLVILLAWAAGLILLRSVAYGVHVTGAAPPSSSLPARRLPAADCW